MGEETTAKADRTDELYEAAGRFGYRPSAVGLQLSAFSIPKTEIRRLFSRGKME